VKTFDSTKPYLPHHLKSKELLTTKEVRSVLRCSNETIRRYRNDGGLEFVKLNQRRILHTTDSLVKFIANGHRR